MSSFLIYPSVQHYHWGKRGKSSRVATLLDAVDPAKTYAEAWYGDHEKSPSLLRQDSKNLREKVIGNPQEILGSRIIEKFGTRLPFLFKVLSVDAPLSIQVHPSLQQAKLLHAKDPVNYPDTNHKPEVVVALSEFEVLSGFKQKEQIQELFTLFPEMSLILGKELSASAFEQHPEILSTIIQRFYATDTSTLQRVVSLIIDRLERSGATDYPQKFFLQIVNKGFQADPGVFVALFLQHKVLLPGEAMYTPARVLHAYLKGDAIECMANSDNVVRAGLTPKHQDVEALLEVVDWSKEAKPIFFDASSQESTQVLETPAEEFRLHIYRNCNQTLGRLGTLGSPELLVMLEGAARTSFGVKMEAGDALFIPADCTGDTIITESAYIVRVSIP